MLRVLQGLFLWPWIALTSKKKIRMVAQKPNLALKYINEMFEAGKLVPIIDGPYKFSDIHQALRHYEKAEQLGKVVITMDPSSES